MNTNQEKLAALAASAARKAELTANLSRVKEERDLAVSLAKRRRDELTRETADVEKLEGKTISNLLYTVTGRMEEKRAAETAEADAAGELYETAQARSRELTARVADMEAELRSLGNCDKDLEALLTTMTETAMSEGGDLAAEVTELTEHVKRHTAEAEELGELLTVGKRLNHLVGEMLPILWNAAEKEKHRQADGPLPPYGHGHTFKSEVNAILDQAETYLPMLVSLANAFSTDIMDLPPLGGLQTVQNTFDGTYTTSTLTQIESTSAELEAMTAKVNRSMERIRQVKQKREEAIAQAREAWIRALTR